MTLQLLSLKKVLVITGLSFLSANSFAAQILVPAYFYPSYDPAQSYWDEMESAVRAGASVTAIMNPASGPDVGPNYPGHTVNSDYVAAVDSFRAAGGKVLGYVSTCYGDNNCYNKTPAVRSAQDVMNDVRAYSDFYHVDGIFLDEMSNVDPTTNPAPYSFYQGVVSEIRNLHPEWQIFGNPGTATPKEYAALVDTLVTRENSSNAPMPSDPNPSWMDVSDAPKQAHLYYNAKPAEMQNLIAQAIGLRAGYIYITDDNGGNPWDTLPSYWNEEFQAIKLAAPVASVPVPPSIALMLSGLFLLLRRKLGADPHA